MKSLRALPFGVTPFQKFLLDNQRCLGANSVNIVTRTYDGPAWQILLANPFPLQVK